MTEAEKLKLIAERLPGLEQSVNALAEAGKAWRVSNFMVDQAKEVVLADLNYIQEVINDHDDAAAKQA